jgi:hypothetical protein
MAVNIIHPRLDGIGQGDPNALFESFHSERSLFKRVEDEKTN